MKDNFMLIEDYGQIAGLITANLKKGVQTNTSMQREEYELEISHGSLMAGRVPQGLLILRDRPSHVKLNYYINSTEELLDTGELMEAVQKAGWYAVSDKPIVVETAYRERDKGLIEMLAYLSKCGFEETLSRVRLSRPADEGDGAGDADDMQYCVRTADVRHAAACRQLLTSCFNPLTACLPTQSELLTHLAGGQLLVLAEARLGRICGLLHFKSSKKSAEIKHLAIEPGLRGRGLSACLIGGFLDKHRGLRATVWTGSDNAPALGAYKYFGFKEDGHRSSVMIKRKEK